MKEKADFTPPRKFVDEPTPWYDNTYFRVCKFGHSTMSSKKDLSKLSECPVPIGKIPPGPLADGTPRCGAPMGPWEIAADSLAVAIREGCCADRPKPCSYHEGWIDGYEYGDTH